jgi:hypothetical protein
MPAETLSLAERSTGEILSQRPNTITVFCPMRFSPAGGFDPESDLALNLSSTLGPEIDPHRTTPTELAGMCGEGTSQGHGQSTEKRC